MEEKAISIRLLGSFQAELGEGQKATFRSDSERALLAFLLMEKDRPHRRESLGALLWPEVSEKQARNNLRVALHRMRQTMEANGREVVIANNRELQFNEDADVWLDVWAFEDALQSVESHDHKGLESCVKCQEKLSEAVELYRGPFLQGFMLEDSQPFLEWVVLKQEWLHRQALETLAILADVHVALEDYEKAEAFARRQLTLEPWREEAHRQLMHALALRGERSAALAQYESCRAVLEEELGAPPSDTTEKLVERIRSGEGYSEEQRGSTRVKRKVELTASTRGFDRRWLVGIAGVVLLVVLGIVGFGSIWSNSKNEKRGGIAWEFEDAGDTEGWVPLYDLGPLTVRRGQLHINSTGDDPYLYIPEGVAFDAREHPLIEMRMKVSDGYVAQVFFHNEGEIDFVEDKSQVFPIVPDGEFHTYMLDMSAQDGWQGMISGLRLDPTDTVASVEIDYIRIVPKVEAESAGLIGGNVYDNFNELGFDGAYDSGKWIEPDWPGLKCEIFQQDGVLRASNHESLMGSGCTFRAKRPLAVAGGELGDYAADLQLLDTHNGGFAGTVLRITTEFEGGGWAASCGILADFDALNVQFDVSDARLSEDDFLYQANLPADYNTWYEVVLQIDEGAKRITCMVDGQVVGEYLPENATELASALMNRELGVWHETDAMATTLIDDVEIQVNSR
ncbi:MAG: hypothetical protein DWQ07_23095 [Chloroflexi bacterium]|nr:MAG: hypothetical protein DWQ07_23095 [Chloroflexota bacterium]MBL1194036.1 hypothetical protein [Chloroflexota bacterium]NOH11330.1 hypothetical protein [Chloroflexota bacterium]